MTKNVLLIPGWGQKPEVLSGVVREDLHKTELDYAVYPSKQALLATLKDRLKPDITIGWSLGGQLAVELIANGLIQTRLLVLIAAPYQYVSDDPAIFGISTANFRHFWAEYENNPGVMLKRFEFFIAQGDKQMKKVVKGLKTHTGSTALKYLGYWLKQLDGFSAKHIDFSGFPPTVIIHGKDDAVTHVGQSQLLHAAIPNSTLYIEESCGHAPHLHDAGLIQNHIEVASANAGI